MLWESAYVLSSLQIGHGLCCKNGDGFNAFDNFELMSATFAMTEILKQIVAMDIVRSTEAWNNSTDAPNALSDTCPY
jgi:hypothetical protein